MAVSRQAASAPGLGEGVAYGLRLRGVDSSRLVPANGLTWPTVDVRQMGGAMPGGEPWLGDGEGLLDLDGLRRVHLLRSPATATFRGEPLLPGDLLHPYFGPVGIAFSRWLGRETFHAGAFVAGGGAWAVVGPREAGKSSLLTALARRGVGVLADDLVVVDSLRAFAGPRMLDLRTPPAAELAEALPVERARRGTRWRIRLGAVEPVVPLRGWIFLRWSERVRVERVRTPFVLSRLARWRGRPELPTDPAQMLELAALPAWDVHRPKRWDAVDDTVATLLDVTG